MIDSGVRAKGVAGPIGQARITPSVVVGGIKLTGIVYNPAALEAAKPKLKARKVVQMKNARTPGPFPSFHRFTKQP